MMEELFVQGYVPSGKPSMAMASETRMKPLGCVFHAIMMVVGWRWMPSAMMPKKGFWNDGEGGEGEEVEAEVVEGEVEGVFVPSKPNMPGLRWCKGRIALKRWVIMDAPVVIARWASS